MKSKGVSEGYETDKPLHGMGQLDLCQRRAKDMVNAKALAYLKPDQLNSSLLLLTYRTFLPNPRFENLPARFGS